MPTTAGGAAVKRNGRPTSAPRLVRCSTIGMPGGEERRVDRPLAADGAVDVHRVDADHRRTASIRRSAVSLREVRVRRVAVGVGAPVPVPPGREQDRPAGRPSIVGQVRPFDERRPARRPPAPGRGRRGRGRRGTGGTACRGRCRCWPPSRCARSGTPRPARSAPRDAWRLRWSEITGPGRPG